MNKNLLTYIILVLLLCLFVGCRKDRTVQFISVDCVGDDVIITTMVPHLYEGTLDIDGVPFQHPTSIPKSEFSPGPHVVTLTCIHVGPQPPPFLGYQAYGPAFSHSVVFEIDEDDGNNGHGNDDDHDDESNPGQGKGGHGS